MLRLRIYIFLGVVSLCLLTNTLRGYIFKIPQGGILRGEVMEDKKCCCCCERHKERSPEEYKALMNRLNRIEGQIRGIKGMVENGAYCPDILVQSAAVNAAVNAFNKELLASHIRSCVVNDIRDGKDEVIDELVCTLQKLMK
jgi:CsoR family transcriptional regulator, copper-sensing transcriptional repressor